MTGAGGTAGLTVHNGVSTVEALVALVLAGSPAARAGIEADDQIVAVDGVGAANMSGHDLVHKLTQASGDEVAMTVRRGGNLVETRLMLQEMLP